MPSAYASAIEADSSGPAPNGAHAAAAEERRCPASLPSQRISPTRRPAPARRVVLLACSKVLKQYAGALLTFSSALPGYAASTAGQAGSAALPNFGNELNFSEMFGKPRLGRGLAATRLRAARTICCASCRNRLLHLVTARAPRELRAPAARAVFRAPAAHACTVFSAAKCPLRKNQDRTSYFRNLPAGLRPKGDMRTL